MLIYGCDFSGAKDPNGKIFITTGLLEQGQLTIMDVTNCEDRLDLFYKIKNSAAPWGIDFPFSIPKEHLAEHYSSSWRSFIESAYTDTRLQFKHKFGKVHSGKDNKRDCRVTDIAVGGKSPIAETPISMNGMLYGGRKLLNHLQGTASIYPFDAYMEGAARVYEVYPSLGWTRLGLARESYPALEQLGSAFQNRVDTNFTIKLDTSIVPLQTSGKKIGIPNEHAADSLMACIIMAYSQHRYSIDSSWQDKPEFASEDEWLVREQEGLVVRM